MQSPADRTHPAPPPFATPQRSSLRGARRTPIGGPRILGVLHTASPTAAEDPA
ncbi:hypothetical protein ABZW30_05550 [Kitasatospora sp. NPDC004669]|uniref:hypothetical protein n=1 Tax=Kitasatospora sp. NPDC004669 TaxID=3154555 RepID=UPI0033BEBD4C